MRRDERDEIMYYSGVIKGICDSLQLGDIEFDSEEDMNFTKDLIGKLLEISSDLECIAKGIDKPMSMRNIVTLAPIGDEVKKGGDENGDS